MDPKSLQLANEEDFYNATGVAKPGIAPKQKIKSTEAPTEEDFYHAAGITPGKKKSSSSGSAVVTESVQDSSKADKIRGSNDLFQPPAAPAVTPPVTTPTAPYTGPDFSAPSNMQEIANNIIGKPVSDNNLPIGTPVPVQQQKIQQITNFNQKADQFKADQIAKRSGNKNVPTSNFNVTDFLKDDILTAGKAQADLLTPAPDVLPNGAINGDLDGANFSPQSSILHNTQQEDQAKLILTDKYRLQQYRISREGDLDNQIRDLQETINGQSNEDHKTTGDIAGLVPRDPNVKLGSTPELRQKLQDLKDYRQKLTEAIDHFANLNAAKESKGSAVVAGRIKREIVGDPTVKQDKRNETHGWAIDPEHAYRNEKEGISAQNDALEAQYVDKPLDDSYWNQKYSLLNQDQTLPSRHPEFAKKQWGKIIGNQIYENINSVQKVIGFWSVKDQIKKAAAALKAKGIDIPESILKDISVDDIPTSSAVSSLVGGAYNEFLKLGAGIARIGGNAIGINPDYITHLNESALQAGQERFTGPEGSQTDGSPSVVDTRPGSSFLLNIENKNAGKANYTGAGIINGIAKGIGQFGAMLVGMKGLGKVFAAAAPEVVAGAEMAGGVGAGTEMTVSAATEAAPEILKPSLEQLQHQAGMTAYMIGSGYENHYQNAKKIITGNTASDELARHLYAITNGYIDKAVFDVLPSGEYNTALFSAEKEKSEQELAEALSKTPLNSMADTHKEIIEDKVRKVLIQSIPGTLKETAKIGGAGILGTLANKITNHVFGNDDKEVSRQDAQIMDEVVSSIEHLPISMMVPLYMGEIAKNANNSRLMKESFYDVGMHPETYISKFADMVQSGMMSDGDARKKMEVIAVMKKTIDGIPDLDNNDEKLTHAKRVDFFYNRLKEVAQQIEIDKHKDDPVLFDIYSEKMQEHVDKRKEIMEGGDAEYSQEGTQLKEMPVTAANEDKEGKFIRSINGMDIHEINNGGSYEIYKPDGKIWSRTQRLDDAIKIANEYGIPTMITRKMESDLKDRGYSQEDIDKMKPSEAHEILNPSKKSNNGNQQTFQQGQEPGSQPENNGTSKQAAQESKGNASNAGDANAGTGTTDAGANTDNAAGSDVITLNNKSNSIIGSGAGAFLNAEEKVQTLVDVRKAANDVKLPAYKAVLKSKDATVLNDALKQISEQWHDEASRSQTEKNFPPAIIEAAKKLHPMAEDAGLQIPEELSPEEVQKKMQPITDNMATIEREVSNHGYNIDVDHDHEIIVTDKKGEIVHPDDLPENIKRLAGIYETVAAKMGDYDESSFNASLEKSRKDAKGEETTFTEVKKEIGHPDIQEALAKDPINITDIAFAAGKDGPKIQMETLSVSESNELEKTNKEYRDLVKLDEQNNLTEEQRTRMHDIFNGEVFKKKAKIIAELYQRAQDKGDNPDIINAVDKYLSTKTNQHAIFFKKPASQVLRDQGIRGESGLPPVVSGNEPKDVAKEGEAAGQVSPKEKEVTRDVLPASLLAKIKGKPVVKKKKVNGKPVEEFHPENITPEIQATGDELLKDDNITVKNIEDYEKTISDAGQTGGGQPEGSEKTGDVPVVVQSPQNEQKTDANQDTGGTTIPGQERTDPTVEPPKPEPEKSAEQKKKDALKAALDDFHQEFKKSMGKLNIGVDPTLLAKGIALVGRFIDLGVYKFGEIVKHAVEVLGERSEEFLSALKKAYGAHITESDHEELDDSKTVRNFTYADLDKVDFDEAAKKLADEPTTGESAGSLGELPPQDVTGLLPQDVTETTGEEGTGTSSGKELGPVFGSIERIDPLRDERDPGERTESGNPDATPLQSGPGTRGSHTTSIPNAAINEDLGGHSVPMEVAKPGDGVITHQHGENFIIPANFVHDEKFSLAKKFDDNIAALRLVVDLYENKRHATEQEKHTLFKYVGFGAMSMVARDPEFQSDWIGESDKMQSRVKEVHELAKRFDEIAGKREGSALSSILASILNAHYTAIPVIRGMYNVLEAAGFPGGRTLEPSLGIGHFFGAMPNKMANNSVLTGNEKDLISMAIAYKLYPNIIPSNKGYEHTNFANDYFDLTISNVPFGKIIFNDESFKTKELKAFKGSIHNAFIAKMIQQTRPGGLISVITSSYTMNAQDPSIRQFIFKNTEFLGAIRMPRTAFQANAGTSVTTDILFMRKFNKGEKKVQKHDFMNSPATMYPATDLSGDIELNNNEYFINHPEHVLGTTYAMTSGGLNRSNELGVVDQEGRDLEKSITDLANNIVPEPIYTIVNHGTDPLELKETIKNEDALSRPDAIVKTKDGYGTVSGGVDSEGNHYIEPLTRIPKYIKPGQIDQFIGIKKALHELYDAEHTNENDNEIQQYRNALNVAYDNYVKVHGNLSSNQSNFLTKNDADGPKLLALEKREKGTGKIVKSDIFTRRAIKAQKTKIEVDNIHDAVLNSLNLYNKVDLPSIAAALNITEEEAITQAGDLIFENPAGGFEISSAYLSGDVKDKLAEAQKAFEINHRFEKNIKALEAIIPKDVPIEDLRVNVGSRWIPIPVNEDFLKDKLGVIGKISFDSHEDMYKLDVIAGGNDPLNTSEFGMSKPNSGRIAKRTGDELFELALNNKNPIINFPKDSNGGGGGVDEDSTELARAKQNMIKSAFEDWIISSSHADNLVRTFNDMYNRVVKRNYDGSHQTFPGYGWVHELMKHQRDGVFMLLQNNGGIIDHIVGSGKSAILALFCMEARRLGIARKPMIAALKANAAIIARDFLEVYPNANILVPTDADFTPARRQRILSMIANNDYDAVILTHEMFGKIPQAPEAARALIEEEMKEATENLRRMRGKGVKPDSRTLKEAQAKIIKLQARIDDLQTVKDDVLDMAKMGIDHIMVDESQAFKNLIYSTNLSQVAGLSPAKGSQRAFNMLVAVRHMQQIHGGDKGVTFLSGTPITNSLVEMYLLLKYMRPSYLAKRGLNTFDAWASVFAKITRKIEFNVTGTFKEKVRMSEFLNVPEMAMSYNETDDVRTDANIFPAIDKPKYATWIDKDGVKHNSVQLVASKMTPGQEAFMRNLIEAGRIKGKSDTAIAAVNRILGTSFTKKNIGAKMLVITTKAAKASLDMGLLGKSYRGQGSKLDTAGDIIANRYKETTEHKGVQLVYSDFGTPKAGKPMPDLYDYLEDDLQTDSNTLAEIFGDPPEEETELRKFPSMAIVREKMKDVLSLDDEAVDNILQSAKDESANSYNVYDELKKKLIERGIPPEEIAFIHSYPNAVKRRQFFEDIKAGKYRVVMGSTSKLGTGVNVQERIVGMHHLDIPWTPEKYEQRNGRGIRQGNLISKLFYNNEVPVNAYGTMRSLDTYKFELLGKKQKIITEVKSNSVTARDFRMDDDEDSEYAAMVAELSENPIFYEKEKLEKEKSTLEKLSRSFIAEQGRARQSIENSNDYVRRLKSSLPNYEEDNEHVTAELERVMPGVDEIKKDQLREDALRKKETNLKIEGADSVKVEERYKDKLAQIDSEPVEMNDSEKKTVAAISMVKIGNQKFKNVTDIGEAVKKAFTDISSKIKYGQRLKIGSIGEFTITVGSVDRYGQGAWDASMNGQDKNIDASKVNEIVVIGKSGNPYIVSRDISYDKTTLGIHLIDLIRKPYFQGLIDHVNTELKHQVEKVIPQNENILGKTFGKAEDLKRVQAKYAEVSQKVAEFMAKQSAEENAAKNAVEPENGEAPTENMEDNPDDEGPSLADKIRGGKFGKGNTYSSILPIQPFWDAAVELVARLVEGGTSLIKAMKRGLESIREDNPDAVDDVNEYNAEMLKAVKAKGTFNYELDPAQKREADKLVNKIVAGADFHNELDKVRAIFDNAKEHLDPSDHASLDDSYNHFERYVTDQVAIKDIDASAPPPDEPPPDEPLPVDDPELTKMANAYNDARMEGKFGAAALDDILAKLQDTDLKAIYNKVKDLISRGIIDVKRVRERLLLTRQGSEEDQAALLYDLAELKGREGELIKEINDTSNPKRKQELQDQLKDIQDDMSDNWMANRVIGRSASTIFRIRQLFARQTSLEDMKAEYKASKGLGDLSPDQEKDIKMQYDWIRELEAKAKAAKAERDQAFKENERLHAENEKLKEFAEQAKKRTTADKDKKVDEKIKSSKDRIAEARERLRKLGGNLNSGIDPRYAVELGKIAAEYFYQGVVKFADLVTSVWHEVRDVLPGFTEDMVRDHLLNEAREAARKYYASSEGLQNSSEDLKAKVKAYNDVQKEHAMTIFQWQRDRRTDVMAKRPFSERAIDYILRWQRFAILSYPSTIVKLAAVVGHQLILKPIKLGAQWLAHQIVRQIAPMAAEKQSIWGNPTARALGKYYSTFFRNFSLANLKEQFTGIDTKEILYGKAFMYDEWAAGHGFLEMPGRTHGYIKSFIKNPEFQFAHETTTSKYIDRMMALEEKMKDPNITDSEREALEHEYKKWDITQDDVMERVNKISLEHGKWAIFMNENRFVKKFQEFANKQGIWNALIRSELPIVKIPLNYIGRAFAIKYGIIRAIIGKGEREAKVTGGESVPNIFKIISTAGKGLNEDQADLLGKSLTLGTIGASFFAIGYLLRSQIKKNSDDSYEMWGTHISKQLIHSPELEAIFSGANTGNAHDLEKNKNVGEWLENFIESDIETLKKNPFANMLKYGMLPNLVGAMFSKAPADQVKLKVIDVFSKKLADMTIPGFIKQPAQWMDTDQPGMHPMGDVNPRYPSSKDNLQRFWQGIEVNIPGLRENVPIAGQSHKNIFSKEEMQTDPSLQIFDKHGLPVHPANHSTIKIPDEATSTLRKLNDYPPEKIKEFDDLRKGFLKENLDNLRAEGAYVNKFGKVFFQDSKDEERDAKTLDQLTETQLKEILSRAGAKATQSASAKFSGKE